MLTANVICQCQPYSQQGTIHTVLCYLVSISCCNYLTFSHVMTLWSQLLVVTSLAKHEVQHDPVSVMHDDLKMHMEIFRHVIWQDYP